jgi:hypothetical protein
MLYADYQMIPAKREDELQFAANSPHKLARKYNVKITTKTKLMAICGKDIQRAKIVIVDIII